MTNIIESFGKISPKFNHNLETRWISMVNSFAMYFPSKQKIKKAKQKGFQYTNNKGEYFLSQVEKEENIEKSKEKFQSEMEKMFPFIQSIPNRSITTDKEEIHRKLVQINNIQNKIIDLVESLEKLIKDKNVCEFLKEENEQIEKMRKQKEKMIERTKFWNQQNKEISKLWKILSWTKKYQEKISNHLKIFVNEEENFGSNVIDIEWIEKYYADKIQKKNQQINEINKRLEMVQNHMTQYEKELEKLKPYDIEISDRKEDLITNKEQLDIWIDTNTRYVSFWLAVHYYEARWLEGECALTPKQKGTTYNNVLRKFYNRLSMITPCMVMTFYMLPRQFTSYHDEENKEFLYNFIDTLIVDEAGQVSTEIGACSFSLAKKAIVVGDEKQIQPVWGIERPLDKSLAIQEKVIKNEKEFNVLQQYGLTASSSSIMRVACKASNYRKNDEKGLFLSEHRRCFDTIIQYCNQLVYKRQLNPLRGNGEEKEILPKMGYYLIKSKKSKKVGTSRSNTVEAVGIARWILKNEKMIFDHYHDIGQDKVLGIITPFKEQANEIERVFKNMLLLYLKNRITVGTVHAFQGGERKVIILSTTYGSEDGCFFIDHNKNIMNVAVSRAEDSFLVFGDCGCLKDEAESPSGLLKKYVMDQPI